MISSSKHSAAARSWCCPGKADSDQHAARSLRVRVWVLLLLLLLLLVATTQQVPAQRVSKPLRPSLHPLR